MPALPPLGEDIDRCINEHNLTNIGKDSKYFKVAQQTKKKEMKMHTAQGISLQVGLIGS